MTVENKEEPKTDEIVQRYKTIDRFLDIQKTISTRSIYIGFGLIALCFTLLSSNHDNDLTISMTSENTRDLLVLSLYLGVCTVIADYLQNVFSYMSTRKAVNNKDTGFEFVLSWEYYTAYGLFWLKQLFALSGSITFAFAFWISNKMSF